MEEKKYKVWTCKIVIADEETPSGFDSPPRMAAQEAIEAAGFEVLMNASGWGGTLTKADMEHINEPKGKYPDVYFAGLMDSPEDVEH